MMAKVRCTLTVAPRAWTLLPQNFRALGQKLRWMEARKRALMRAARAWARRRAGSKAVQDEGGCWNGRRIYQGRQRLSEG